MKCTCLVGLPGSGKTYHGIRLGKRDIIFLDDIKDLRPIYTLTKQKEDIIIADVNFCETMCRVSADNVLKGLGYEVEWIFFENNKEKCIRNINRRYQSGDTRDVMTTLKIMSEVYKVPENIVAREIWDGED
jgi:hypothetical protein